MSKERCIAQYGRVTGQCTFTGDSNETPSDCDCDEYPFAATNQGAKTGAFSVKRIDASDNRRAGAFLGDFFRAQRVLDADEFYVDVEPAGASPASKRR
ncbi:NucA/NucB deoxyribonuclease domain-containing protein [Burkholderia sp. HI2714]|uniref:NucA/NucB deoxyribonuclease domain-containing protein n=1 Tax=Burkholderia sp. HI2714 TaxID=2015359 RepID=UPI00211B53DF|nr:NucA/NucB deoxyribonuclease domain-containing protein [Burkholderia sp. HI2714]